MPLTKPTVQVETELRPSVAALLETIRSQYPGVPFLALGQTALWDEPAKAVWRTILDQHLPGAALISGVHDTDYFAKTTAHIAADDKFAVLRHDDGRTRDLWSAAGEMSSLFGSESVPTRHMYMKHGVPFDWLARHEPGGKANLYDAMTAAWGWTGLVHTEQHHVIAHDIPICDILTALLRQMDLAFMESLSCLEDPQSRAAASELCERIKDWARSFAAHCDGATSLTDLYRDLLPKIYQLLLQHPPLHFSATTTTQLLRFHSETYQRPRFAVVDLFLQPATRAAAIRAYNSCVAGSGIYGLENFGPGAIPFDLVVPGLGRGTIGVSGSKVTIEFGDTPAVLTSPTPVQNLETLARVIENAYGDRAVLVGKAITLINMLAAEHLVVFHETASGYTSSTEAFNTALAKSNITQSLYPIVRLEYGTWDALADSNSAARLRLPSHLAAAYGAQTVSAAEFGTRWRDVVADQKSTLREIKSLNKMRDLLTYLEAKEFGDWSARRQDYEQALATLSEYAQRSEVLRQRVEEHRREMAMWKEERAQLEARMGDDWRRNSLPLVHRLRHETLSDAERAQLETKLAHETAVRERIFAQPLAIGQDRIRASRRLIASFQHQRRLLERGSEPRAARATLEQITVEAQRARMRIVHDAYITVDSLEHTNLRPTAWWFPLVDPSGAWFEGMAARVEARFEYVTPR
ncbi:hypothetical protein CCAX7_39930 [Capsulimonas corticalis]|uniref:Uncharacterized protein n=1 Tax=Capsulimonas corticalis TaxID=2219043 RepID=A0A402D4X8_9BACT|nr:hypothetical protein [Capsulimonas corticalis]BDI31942.1 hypothetical protein CCAX7_39930 [Capsulimonas corticalis]